MTSRDTEGHPVLNATRARQGLRGRHILMVLIFGTVLAGLAMFAAWTWRSAVEPPAGPATEQASGAGMDTPAPPTPTRQAP